MIPRRPQLVLLGSLACLVLSSVAGRAERPTSPADAPAVELSAVETEIVDAIADRADTVYPRLAELVGVNSGTFHPAGVRAVGELLTPSLEALGLVIEWVEPSPESNRGPHLVARSRALDPEATHVLLIGHLDTVFEPGDPFRELSREDEVARGPGAVDMKGGDLVILLALEGLSAAGALSEVTVTAFFTGDEEAPGKPLSASRAALVEAARAADVALGFESGCCRSGVDKAVVARRSFAAWKIEIEGRRAHSSGIFSDEVGAGAAFETARILDAFYTELSGEEGLTYNAATILAGTDVEYDPAEHRGSASGKTNVVPARAVVQGDLRALTPDQESAARKRMREIVSRHRPGTSASIVFDEGYPPMPPTEGNLRLLALYDRASRDLGLGPVDAHPPSERGAADISFAAPYAEALGGLGPEGSGDHTPEELVDLPTIVEAAQRAALLIHRLARAGN